MLYVKNKLIPYPGRTVMEDVLIRTGNPDKYSYTPYPGMIDIFRKQFYNQGEVSEEDFIRYCREGTNEFNPSMIKPDDSLDAMTLEEALVASKVEYDYISDSNSFYWKLEDIDANWVAKYVNMKAIGYKREKRGRAVHLEATLATPIVYDLETNAAKSVGEFQESDYNKDIMEVLRAKEKLPFLLKQLHKGSISKKASLMSFIIAAERAHKRYCSDSGDKIVFSIEPRDFYTYATTYEMKPDGKLGRPFEAKDNKCAKFRDIVAWMRGEFPNDVYFGYYNELLKVAATLDISLADEDPTVYQGEFIQQMECTYLASNMEYLKNDVYLDNNILNILTPEKLFQRGIVLDKHEDEVVREPNKVQSARTRLSNIKDVVQKCELNYNNASMYIQQMLSLWAKNTGTRMRSVAEYSIVDGLLCDSTGDYLIVDPSTIIVDAPPCKCYVSANGWIIRDVLSKETISYYDLQRCNVSDRRVAKYATELLFKAI